MTRIWKLALILLSSIPALATAYEAEGLVLPAKEVNVGSPLQEIIAEIRVEEGDVVEKGQVLAVLRNDRERLDVQRYRKVIEKARFDHEAARALFEESIGTREQALEKQVELERLEIEYQLARTRLAEKTIHAPIAGIVVKKHHEAGEPVDRVETMFEIVDIDTLIVRFLLPAKLMGSIEVGETIEVGLPDLPVPEKHPAEIVFVDPRIDVSSGLFRVKLELGNPERRLKSGMRAVATFPDE